MISVISERVKYNQPHRALFSHGETVLIGTWLVTSYRHDNYHSCAYVRDIMLAASIIY